MFRWSKKTFIPLVLVSLSYMAIGQERVAISPNQDATPVFKSIADAISYFKNQSAMLQ